MIDNIKAAEDSFRELIFKAREIVANGVTLPEFGVEIPGDKSHGDFATNAALCSSKALKMPPRKIAEEILSKIDFSGTCFSHAEIAGPGFINVFLADSWFGDTVKSIIEADENYGRTNHGAGKSRLVEFVSANPTGPMHIGNARGGALGDVIAESLDWAGYKTEREFYVNDAGQQVIKFGASLGARYLQVCSEAGKKIAAQFPDTENFAQKIYDDIENFPMSEGLYLGTDILIHAKNYYDTFGEILKDETDEKRNETLADYALPININGLERDLKRYGITYDNWFKESTLHNSGAVDEIIKKLKESGYTYEADGAIWLRTTEFGDEKDRVLVRANGVPTYVVPDIAYHYDKLVKRGFDKAVDILGADHHGYIMRIKAALSALGVDPDRLDIVIMQMVMLVRNGEAVKLSKRSGKAITLNTLLDEIPIDAARFFFNLREPNSHFEMDLDLAVEESSKNPVYYVEYAHARICSIIRNLAQDGLSPDVNADLSLLVTPEEKNLISNEALLPQTIIQAAEEYNPSLLTRYATETASAFHKFYDKCRIKGEEQALATARLTLCLSVKITLRNTLKILGIKAPEKM
ncbi:MAG: arginine--tRNA ligase [Ruminococcus sp.]|jgi:arginyl-tRNA synthetase|nr:arginine--tRNA ligase [Ruminococcus sp.]